MFNVPWKQSVLWPLVLYLLCFIFMQLLPGAMNKLVFQPPDKTAYKDVSFFIHSASGNKIAAIYYQQTSAKYTILYSHGNAEDMSQISNYLKDLGTRLSINILLYDYSGYGLSEGDIPSEMTLYADIESVYNHLIQTLHIKSEHIILYGASLGTGPTCYFASKYSKHIGGVILQSPFKSIATIFIPEFMMRILKHITFRNKVDMFRNMDYIENIKDCPVLIIHGTHDHLIPFSHGQYLYDRLKENDDASVSNFWVENCGHNDIEWLRGRQLRAKLKDFIDYDVDKQPLFVTIDTSQ
eukprot:23515_1